ncbi:hypothetical protein [Ornithinibacillus halotolerans]|uniref:Uncharacterized protein n=1 Tax=Ornithinibacillus halotolerans TaxID=1274357 RepID=A0A916W795_9BACI|nr:hypothetical protein [Ornithinibacillus halotolerans]GGA71868.1 hypothetical protein GCM10008025_14600 [Ornithinibacillus halotolerans]
MEKREIVILSALTFTIGLILGFLASPMKKGVINIQGNNNTYRYKPSEVKKEE